ncbi:MAG: aminomethyl-transferring glycine dehydrogenase subunit GcvPA [Eubacteriales bacterium]|nr:aminomethyl-transferring glycine dehydrogenase subunit GcvPA [Eubacteriales bacterium]MDD4460992.1 aminomethyl-transferring glycine dehydrogenase subunit GcvPA [Eubacteriales bacterium]
MNRYIPMTDDDRRAMLDTIGVPSLEALFADIPDSLCLRGPAGLAPPLSELALRRRMRELASRNADTDRYACFLGAGCYDHEIPAIVSHLTGRQEFYTAYTPYQPEISQGLLQAIFEYQTMICELTGMEAANASMYDGATAAAEAILLACQATRRRRVLVSDGLHPHTLAVLRTYQQTGHFDLEIISLSGGRTDADVLQTKLDPQVAAVLIQNPNFFGVLEEMPSLTAQAHHVGAYLVAVVNPISLALLEAPGRYGADLVVGDGQVLGNAMNFGGPSLGFFAAGSKDLRRLPGRLIGQTQDRQGRRGFVMTMQTREQHIRRDRATSNICSNQALNALAAAIYMTTVGQEGLCEIARQSVSKAHYLHDRLIATGRFSSLYDAPFFSEFAVRCEDSPVELNRRLLQHQIIGGLALSDVLPEMENDWLLAATEKSSRSDMDQLVERAVL